MSDAIASNQLNSKDISAPRSFPFLVLYSAPTISFSTSLWLEVNDTKLLHDKIEVSSTCGMTNLKKGQDHHHKIYDASGKK